MPHAYAGVCPNFDDAVSNEQFYTKLKRSGYSGAGCVTPMQASIVNSVFSMSGKEKHMARAVGEDNSHIGYYQYDIQSRKTIVGPPHKAKFKKMIKVNSPGIKAVAKTVIPKI